jgi:hypothetical protein
LSRVLTGPFICPEEGHAGKAGDFMKLKSAYSLFPAFFALTVAVAVFVPALREWVPRLSALIPIGRKAAPPDPTVKVWINSRSGFYYCRESALFEKSTPGAYMLQGLALENGYRPAETACRQSSQDRPDHGASPQLAHSRDKKSHPNPAVETRINSNNRDGNIPSQSSKTDNTATATQPISGQAVAEAGAKQERSYNSTSIRR